MTFGLKIYNLKLQYNRFFPILFFGKNGLILDSFFFYMSVDLPRLSKRKKQPWDNRKIFSLLSKVRGIAQVFLYFAL